MTAGTAPDAPRLAALRRAWVDGAEMVLRQTQGVLGLALVGSLGRGDADDWSDVDMQIVVDDTLVDDMLAPANLRRFGHFPIHLDARHNAPSGVRAVSGQCLVDGLPLWVDVYAYPVSQAGWPADAKVLFGHNRAPALPLTFEEHLERREPQPPTPKSADDRRRLQLALVPVAGKRVARRSPDVARMTTYLGGQETLAVPTAQIAELRRLLDTHVPLGPLDSIHAGHAYLDIVEQALGLTTPTHELE